MSRKNCTRKQIPAAIKRNGIVKPYAKVTNRVVSIVPYLSCIEKFPGFEVFLPHFFRTIPIKGAAYGMNADTKTPENMQFPYISNHYLDMPSGTVKALQL